MSEVKSTYFYGLGRRKEAIARARVFLGKGIITVNGKPHAEYFGSAALADQLEKALDASGEIAKLYATILVSGGGKRGQAEASTLAIARALLSKDPELKTTLRKAGLLTRDSREKERKKPGLKRARKAPQFSKR